MLQRENKTDKRTQQQRERVAEQRQPVEEAKERHGEQHYTYTQIKKESHAEWLRFDSR